MIDWLRLGSRLSQVVTGGGPESTVANPVGALSGVGSGRGTEGRLTVDSKEIIPGSLFHEYDSTPLPHTVFATEKNPENFYRMAAGLMGTTLERLKVEVVSSDDPKVANVNFTKAHEAAFTYHNGKRYIIYRAGFLSKPPTYHDLVVATHELVHNIFFNEMVDRYFGGERYADRANSYDKMLLSNKDYYQHNEVSTHARALKSLHDAGVQLPESDYNMEKEYINDANKMLNDHRLIRLDIGDPKKWQNQIPLIPEEAYHKVPSLIYYPGVYDMMMNLQTSRKGQ